jgi:hypothetical protein
LDTASLLGILYGRITSSQQTFLKKYIPSKSQGTLNTILNAMTKEKINELFGIKKTRKRV